jgi:hypothetical protein
MARKQTAATIGSLTPRDLIGRLDVLRVECAKCDRAGQYRLAALVDQIGIDGKLTDWLSVLTEDCPCKASYSDPCGATCPDLLRTG